MTANTNTTITLDSRSQPILGPDTVITKAKDGSPVSYLYDNEWDFSSLPGLPKAKAANVKFTSISDQTLRRAIQEVLGKMVLTDEGTLPTKVVNNRLGLCHIAKGINSHVWSELNHKDGWNRFTRSISGKYASNTVESIASTINLLYRLNYTTRRIDFDGLNLYAIDKPTQQAIAIPISMYQSLLTHCIGTVEKYHKYRYEISRVMMKVTSYHAGLLRQAGENITRSKKGNINEKVRRYFNRKVIHDIPDFEMMLNGRWVIRILTDCLVVCGMFSGARVGEILTFSKSSFQVRETLNGSIYTLRGETSKGNDGIEKNVTWQTHPIVKQALELAYDMTEYARVRYRNMIEQDYFAGRISLDKLNRVKAQIECAFIQTTKYSRSLEHFAFSNPSKRTNDLMSSLHLKASLEDVEEFDRLNPARQGQLLVGGSLPKLSPHDLRRSFAVFVKRHGFGNEMTIKFQYKHRNINMSEYYAANAQLAHFHDVILDTELIDMMEEEGIRIGVDAYDEIYNQSGNLSGVEGERILADRFERLKSGHQVYMRRSEIEVLVRNGTLAIVILPTGGYCTNSDCERLCGIDSFVGEKRECPSKIVTDKEAKKLAKRRNRLIKSFGLMNNGDEAMNHILSGLKQKIISLESTLKKHNIQYSPFTETIEGCYVS